MTTVVMAGEVEARRRQERIRLLASSVRDGIDKIGALVREAKESNDHEALGYKSWTAYLADTLGAEPLRLDRGERREVVALLAGEGMSQRAIAKTIGASRDEVRHDIKVGEIPPAAILERPSPETTARPDDPMPFSRNISTPIDDTPPFDPETGEVLDEPEPQKITGLDGKAYTRPEPSKPRRAPLPDSFWRATYDLGRKVESLERLVKDDRFPQNAQKVATANRSDLVRAIDALQRVVDRLPKEPSPMKEI